MQQLLSPDADIFVCLKEVRKLCAAAGDSSSSDISILGKVIERFSAKIFIPIEYAEMLLVVSNRLMEQTSSEGLLVFAGTSSFVKSLLGVVHSHAVKRSEPISSSFSSHYCYELSMYMLLGLIESSALLTTFLKAITKDDLQLLFRDLGVTIQADSLYLTQEMALEIVCRVSHFIFSHDSAFLRQTLSTFPALLVEPLTSSSESIASLLINMRPSLNLLNQHSPFISSTAFTQATFTSAGQSKGMVTNGGGGWLDICQGIVCFHLLETQCFVRLELGYVSNCQSDANGRQVHVDIADPPEKLLALMQIPRSGGQQVMIRAAFTFGNQDDYEGSATALNARIEEHFQSMDHAPAADLHQKYSVVSSKVSEEQVSSVSSPDMAPPRFPHHAAEVKSLKRLVTAEAQDSLLKAAAILPKQAKPSPADRVVVGGRGRKRSGRGRGGRGKPSRKVEEPVTAAKVRSSSMNPSTATSPAEASPLKDTYQSIGAEDPWQELPDISPPPLYLPHCSPPDVTYSPSNMVVEPPSPPATSAPRPLLQPQSSNIARMRNVDRFGGTPSLRGKGMKQAAQLLPAKQWTEQDKENFPQPTATAASKRSAAGMTRKRGLAGVDPSSASPVKVMRHRYSPESMEVPDAEDSVPQNLRLPPPSAVKIDSEQSGLMPFPYDESAAEVHRDEVQTAVTNMNSSSAEEATVLSNLISEIVDLQRERAQRRRVKSISNMCVQAEKQLCAFVDSWKRYCVGLSADSCCSLNSQIAAVTQILHSLLHSLSQQSESQNALEAEFHSSLQFLASNSSVLTSEIEEMDGHSQRDCKQLEKELEQLRLRYFSQARSALVQVPDKAASAQQLLQAFGGTW